MKEKVCAIFEKPKDCESCPCSYETEGVYINFCQLARYLNPGDRTTDKYELPDYYEGEIPDWCPLVPLTIIGPTKEVI